MTRWEENIIRMLLDAGFEGVRQVDLTNKVDDDIRAWELEAYLESLRIEGAVQRFTLRYGVSHWRATELLPSVV